MRRAPGRLKDASSPARAGFGAGLVLGRRRRVPKDFFLGTMGEGGEGEGSGLDVIQGGSLFNKSTNKSAREYQHTET